MKTKISILLAFISLSFTSCVKDYIGHGSDGKEVILTSDNYLDTAVLQKLSLQDNIEIIEAEIAKLNQISPNNSNYNDAQKKIGELSEQRASLKNQIANIIDLGSVGLNFPIPCDTPNGKCIPSRLEYFIFLKKHVDKAAVLVRNDSNKKIGFSTRLVDLPGYEDVLQYIRIPVNNFKDQIFIEIAKKDANGYQTRFTVGLNN